MIVREWSDSLVTGPGFDAAEPAAKAKAASGPLNHW